MNRARIPWYLWCSALAVTSAYIGGYWDISWHRSIGRDTFWTAPHMAIYACGVLAGIASAYLIFNTTFGPGGAMRAASVRIWGLYGPLGAFICAWGGVAMLASAPFDDWWHNAYGLDVKIISPRDRRRWRRSRSRQLRLTSVTQPRRCRPGTRRTLRFRRRSRFRTDFPSRATIGSSCR